MGAFDDLIPAGAKSDAPTKITVRPGDNKMGAGEAMARGAVSGASLNFDDELAGLYKASGIPDYLSKLPPTARRAIESMPLAKLLPQIVGAGRLGVEALTGEGDAIKNYAEGRDAIRTANKQAEEDQFGANLAGNIIGGMALPVGAVGQAATLPGRMAAGALTGAAVGGLAGAGAGESAADRMTQAGTGAALGGALGAAAPPVIETAGRAIGAVANYPVNVARATINPQAAADRAIRNTAQEAVRADPQALNRLNPNEIVPGGPAILADALGQPGRNLARSASNLSGEASDTLNQTLQPRYEGQSARFINWLNSSLDFPDAFARQQALEQTKRGVNNAAYARARAAGASGIWTPELERLAGSSAVSAAMQKASTVAKDEAIVSGYGAMNPRVTFTPDGRMQFNRGPNGVPTYPDLQFWDLTRRELSDAAIRAGRGTSEARRLEALASRMNEELDRVIPEYRLARRGAAGFFGAENALEAGQNFVNQPFGMAEARAAVARMTPQERQLFQEGFASRYVEWLSKVPDRADTVRRIYNTPAAREKIAIALGPQRANELEAMLRVENIMQQLRGAVTGNSSTVLQLGTAGLAGAGGGAYGGYDPTISGLAAALTVAGKRGVDQRVATRIAQMLVSQDQTILQRGLMITARNNRLMDALRLADRTTAAGSQQVPAIGAIQGPVSAAAQNEQPQPPGAVQQ